MRAMRVFLPFFYIFSAADSARFTPALGSGEILHPEVLANTPNKKSPWCIHVLNIFHFMKLTAGPIEKFRDYLSALLVHSQQTCDDALWTPRLFCMFESTSRG